MQGNAGNAGSAVAPGKSALRLRRALGLPALVLYGIVLIQPTAPKPLFGAAAEKAHGHVVTAIMIGMAASSELEQPDEQQHGSYRCPGAEQAEKG